MINENQLQINYIVNYASGWQKKVCGTMITSILFFPKIEPKPEK